MKEKTFLKLLDLVPELNHAQRVTLQTELTNNDDFTKVCDLLEKRIENNYQCVHYHSSNIIKFGQRSGLTRYRCKSCSKTFNALTGTPLARLRKKGLWLTFVNTLIESISVRKVAKQLHVNLKTTFNWRHHFLGKSHSMVNSIMSGIIEADETFFR